MVFGKHGMLVGFWGGLGRQGWCGDVVGKVVFCLLWRFSIHVMLGGFRGELYGVGRCTDVMRWAGLGSGGGGVIWSLRIVALKGWGQKAVWEECSVSFVRMFKLLACIICKNFFYTISFLSVLLSGQNRATESFIAFIREKNRHGRVKFSRRARW